MAAEEQHGVYALDGAMDGFMAQGVTALVY